MVAGVVSGFSRRHGLDPWVVRGALVVLSFAGGVGLLLYAVGAVLSAEADDTTVVRPADPLRNLSIACMTIGLLAVVRSTGLWLGDAVMVPLVIVVAGAVVLAIARADDTAPSLSASALADVVHGRHARARIAVGTALVAGGLVAVGSGRSVSGTVRVGVFAAAASIIGVVVLVGPWIARLAQTAAEERRERVRSEERAAMAAHLHDSVLQTLALIQRSADDPRRTVSLARQQEHELRAWLFGEDGRPADSLAGAMTAMAHDVERRHDVRVEVVPRRRHGARCRDRRVGRRRTRSVRQCRRTQWRTTSRCSSRSGAPMWRCSCAIVAAASIAPRSPTDTASVTPSRSGSIASAATSRSPPHPVQGRKSACEWRVSRRPSIEEVRA